MTRIRKATIEDAEALAALSGELGYPVDAAAIVRHMTTIAKHDAGVVWVAESEDGRVLGFVHALPLRFVIMDPFVGVAALVVDEGARGTGVGAALLHAAEAWAREHGFHGMRVRSNVIRERAHRFYLREGYCEKKRQAVFVKRF